jgi:GNAT superfamily N-acetyltransferase
VTEFAVRQAGPGDASDLLVLIKDHANFERGNALINSNDLMRVISGDVSGVIIFVAVKGQSLLGYAALTMEFSLWRGNFRTHLDCLFVRDGKRSKGIGAALLNRAKQHSRTNGLDRLEWQTPDWNLRAISFYEREGASGNAKIRFGLDL